MKRRDFLSFIAATSVFSNTAFALSKDSEQKILILIELQGANDGLNTVIPFKHSKYKNLRPNLYIKKNDIQTISEFQGLHPSLKGIADLFEHGEVKIVQNLGYPQPILSHFRSIELWETGGDGMSKGREGWLNKSISDLSLSQDFDGKGIYLDNSGDIFSNSIGFLGPHAIDYSPDKIEGRDTTIPALDEKENLGLLNLVMKKRQGDLLRLKRIKEKLKKRIDVKLRGGSLGKQLSRVCELIGADINIPVYKVSIGSFDTHIDQFWRHRLLLKDLDEAISGTVRELKNIGVWKNTLIMTYSEFGRRAKENGARGTDHGMAAPHFVIGGSIKGGINGGLPNLDKLKNNDLIYEIDYRSLYDFVLNRHFNLEENPFKKFRTNEIA